MRIKAQVEIVDITPHMASEMLKNQVDGQRALREEAVENFVKDMLEGRFRLSPDCIVLIDGKLANGQHRLYGVVKAKKPARFVLLTSNDPQMFEIIDCGIKRTVGDVIDVPSPNSVAAVASKVLSIEQGTISSRSVYRKPRRSEIISFIRENTNPLVEAVRTSDSAGRKTRMLPISLAGAFVYIASKKNDPAVVKKFIADVYSGDSSGDAAKVMNRKLIDNITSRTSRFPAAYMFALLIKAWNSYRKGTVPGQLKLDERESFPQID